MKLKISKLRLSTRSFNLLLVFSLFGSCDQVADKEGHKQPDLFTDFQNPPAEAHPFVRWWWNGNRLQIEEIVRQLDVLQKAGIGVVEINPIALTEKANDLGIEPLTWISKDWNEMLKFAALEAQKRGMLADLIVGF